jgi:glyoxylase-like metal-dependent hydrolase (beta-lactamase superfamily II)
MEPKTETEGSIMKRITEHVYITPPDKATDRPILGAIAGRSGTLIVDAGNSPVHARSLLDELAKMNIPEPKYLVITHGHWDHFFGTSIFDVPIISNQETKLIIDEMANLDWSDEAMDRRVDEGLEIEFCRDMIKAELPCRDNLVIKPPDFVFSSPIELDLGGIRCHLAQIGGDHSSDSSIVYIQEDKVIFLGDCLYPNIHSGTPSYTTTKLLPLLGQLLSYNADYYLAAHDPEVITRQQMGEFATFAKLAGKMAEDGLDRESILRTLQTTIGALPDDDICELVDGLLAGLRKSKEI